MAGKRLITVFGATGHQGGSVARIFLGDPKLKDSWSVRGVTRDVNKDSAKKLAAQGAEMVAANLNDKPSLVKAMTGAYAVYAMTNYWDSLDMKAEIQQGKNLADAAKEAGVKLYIWASLPNVTKLSNGVLSKVYHFDSKAIVEDYVGELGLPAAFFLPGFYMSNIPNGVLRPSEQAGGAWTLGLPGMTEATQLPLFDVADTGKFVKAMVLAEEGAPGSGRRVLGASGYVTVGDVVEAFRRAFPEAGRTASFYRVPEDAFRTAMGAQGLPDFAVEEMLQNFRLCEEFGYYGGAALEDSIALVEEPLATWEEFVKKALPDLK